jgi:hypothetical protein
MWRYISILIPWVIVAFLIFFIVKDNSQFFANGTIIIGWVLFALQLTYNKTSKLKQFSNHIYNKYLKQTDIIWDVSITMSSNINEKHLDNFEIKLFESYDANQIKVHQLSSKRRDYRVGTLKFEINAYEDQTRVVFQDMETNYRRTKEFLESNIDELLGILRLVVKPDKEQINVRLRMPKHNPYLSKYIETNRGMIDYLRMDIKENNTKFSIRKDSIDISSENYNEIKSDIKKLLYFKP